jgi:hypothetical protein
VSKFCKSCFGINVTKDQIKQDALDWPAEVDYATRFVPGIAPDGVLPNAATIDNYRFDFDCVKSFTSQILTI